MVSVPQLVSENCFVFFLVTVRQHERQLFLTCEERRQLGIYYRPQYYLLVEIELLWQLNRSIPFSKEVNALQGK